MKQINMTSPNGVVLHTKNKYVDDDIVVKNGLPTYAGEIAPVGGVSESVAYYKANRNKNYPYFPLPSEMEETQDTIYMLYDASGYMCCPVFNIEFTKCVCTIQKYMNTTLVSEYTLSNIVNRSVNYLQFSEEDSDYSTYNYIVIKLQGNITLHDLDHRPKFNGIEYNEYSSGDLLEVSGKCSSCVIYVCGSGHRYQKNLEYYSFLGSSTTYLRGMFYDCCSLQTLPEFETTNVTSMGYMFYGCYSLQILPPLDTSKVTSMEQMFNNCKALKKLPQLDTSNITSLYYTFAGCNSLKEIPPLNTSNVTDMRNTFSGCYSLQTIPPLDTSKVTDMEWMFSYCYSLKEVPPLDTSNVTSMYNMFGDCYSLREVPQLNTSKVTNMYAMFSQCHTLQTIPPLDTSKVTNMYNMFNSCYALQTIPQLDTSNVTNMKQTFNNCYLLQKADICNTNISFEIRYSTMLSQDELVKILNNLATVTTTQTLTLGSTLLAKLTDDQKAIATAKGWTLA